MKKTLTWIGLSVLMMIYWIAGLFIGNAIFPSSLMDMEPAGNAAGFGELMLFLTCALNTGIVLYFIYNSRIKGWKLVGSVFLISFGIQYFMSQIETLWFNDSLTLPINGIWAIVTGGFITWLLFSVTATWITGNFVRIDEKEISSLNLFPLVKRIVFLSVVVWPLVYFLFGYFVAWQFEDVRLLYSGTTEMGSFVAIMEGNFTSGLYSFQILRGFLWILIGLLVLTATKGSLIRKGVILGLLFAIIGSSQLLLPNPYMSDVVRMAHLIETASGSFIWGFIIAWYTGVFIKLRDETQTGFNKLNLV